MKRNILLCIVLLTCLSINVYAQNESLTGQKTVSDTEINLEINASFAGNYVGKSFEEAAFKINRVRMEFLGAISSNLSYHFRQSYNKYSNPFSLDNLTSSIELAYLNWNISNNFTLTAGKSFVPLGGYEYYVSALRVREFSDFNSLVACYQAGLMGTWKISDTDELVFAISNNRSGSDSDLFPYGLPTGVQPTKLPLIATVNWNAAYADGALQFRYAAAAGSLAQGKNIYYLTAGNIYEKGPILAYFDVMYSREGIDSQGRLSALNKLNPSTAQNVDYLTLIANFDYSFHPKWNAYVKCVYETMNVFSATNSYAAGKYCTTLNNQLCLEYFPLDNDKKLKLYAHFSNKSQTLESPALDIGAYKPNTTALSLGLVYIIHVL